MFRRERLIPEKSSDLHANLRSQGGDVLPVGMAENVRWVTKNFCVDHDSDIFETSVCRQRFAFFAALGSPLLLV